MEGVGHPENKTSFVGFVYFPMGGSTGITEVVQNNMRVLSRAGGGAEDCIYVRQDAGRTLAGLWGRTLGELYMSVIHERYICIIYMSVIYVLYT